MASLPAAEFLPDQPDYANPGSGLVQNVLPLTAQSYGPFPSPSVASGAIANRCQGAISIRDGGGNARIFCGDSQKLYRMDASVTTPADVSLAGGYATSAAERWSFCNFGTRVVATNYTNVPQSFVEGTDVAFSNLISSGTTSLTARYVTVIRDWVVFANTTDANNGVQPYRVWWSAINDPTNFPTPGSNGAVSVQSDYQDLFGDFGHIQGIVGNTGFSHGCVVCEHGIWRMNYQGSPTIFRFDIAEGVRGTAAPGSIVKIGAIVYFLGEDGFYAFDGQAAVPIGFGKVDQFFFNDCDPSYFSRIDSAVDPLTKNIYWAYPGYGSTLGTPNRILVYNWGLKRWSVTNPGDVNIELLFNSESIGYTLEALDPLYSSIDSGNVPSLDDASLAGGHYVLGAFDTNHCISSFSGPSLAATVDTSEAQLNPRGRAFVTQTRPLVDGGTPSVAILTRERLVDPVVAGQPIAMDSNGWCPQRSESRYHRARITLPAGATFKHIQGIDFDAVPSGVR